jgi:hypothetical protein
LIAGIVASALNLILPEEQKEIAEDDDSTEQHIVHADGSSNKGEDEKV